MIRINKHAQAPDVLRDLGNQKKDVLCADFDANEADCRAGKRPFSFDAAIYAHAAVKTALVTAQHGKCCFCESKIGADGDVEHFRPKAGCRQAKKSALLRPGYYWLVYDWNNLLLSCGPCNQRFKRNLLPLAKANDRASCHKDDLTREDPLFINPAEDDPQTFISFRKEIAFPLNVKGKTTIDALGLNREIMREKRRDRLVMLALLRDIVDLKADQMSDAKAAKTVEAAKLFLAQAIKDEAEYAGMARAAQARDFRL